MSEQNPVSPLLDGFTIGTPVNDHFGVCCYPAVKENSERKYIVKVISIPASQTQLDALLITGAYKDPADAAEYFRSLSDNIVQEVEFLQKMSRFEGFVPYEGCQVEAMQKNRVGYEVYLLSGFRLSLERYMHRHTVSHLEAVNLGIDLCAALAACRKAGMIYIDLKPSNIFISNKKEYKIGDLGFAPLDSMKFSPMPEKYRSCYSAPELLDDLNVLNGTADTYALGMILYQLFNNGALPQDLTAPLPAPANADDEMAGILTKACAPNPADRWEDPMQMGQALVNYMQANTINDNPIMDPIARAVAARGVAAYQTTKFPVPAEAAPEAEPAAETAEANDAEAVETPEAETPVESAAVEEVHTSEDPAAETAGGESEAAAEVPDNQAEEAPAPETAPAESEPEAAPEETAEPEEAGDASPVDIPMPTFHQESAENISTDDIDAALSAEFANLSGEGPVLPEEPSSTIDGEHLDAELQALNKILRSTEKPTKKEPKKHPNVAPVIIKPEKKKKSALRVLFTVFLICLLLAGSVWGYMYYVSDYLQVVNGITISENLGKVTVTVDSNVREGLLSVVCTDAYGNTFSQRVHQGKAEFQQLTPGTFYTAQVEIEGWHKLDHPVSDVFTTEGSTHVAAFTAAVGSTDGSVVLNLIVEGHEPDQWRVLYQAEGEPTLSSKPFTGRTTTVENLVLGKTYTFTLQTLSGVDYTDANGVNTATCTASRLISAQNVTIVSCNDGELVVKWDNSTGFEPEFWRVRCAGGDYDETQEVNTTEAIFTGIDSNKSYTIEVSAKGMTQIARVSVSANPITLTTMDVDSSKAEELKLSWQFEGSAPEDGWLVFYTLDNSTLPNVATVDGTTAVVAPRIPGAVYHFSFQAASSEVSVFNGSRDFTCPSGKKFNSFGLTSDNFTLRLLPTPSAEKWVASQYANSFAQSFPAGQPISAVLKSNIGFYLNSEMVSVLLVFRDQYGNVIAELVNESEVNWNDFWYDDDYHEAELDIPAAPTTPGSYTLDLYFDGHFAASATLSIY